MSVNSVGATGPADALYTKRLITDSGIKQTLFDGGIIQFFDVVDCFYLVEENTLHAIKNCQS